MSLKSDGIDGLLKMEKILNLSGLKHYNKLNPKALPGADFDPELLRGGLYLDQGTVRSHPERTSERLLYDVSSDKWEQNINASNTMMVSLGDEVTKCRLRLKPLAGGAVQTVELETDDHGEIKIWIRNTCDLGRNPEEDVDFVIPPKRNDGRDGTERTLALSDEDFVLNYLLLESYGQLLADADGGRRLVPRADPSFQGGGNMDVPHHKCQPVEGSAKKISDPTA